MTIELPQVNHWNTEHREEAKENIKDLKNGEEDHKIKNNTEDGLFRELWDHFSSTSGFHGFNRMSFRLERTSIVRSLVWLVIWLACAVYIIYLLIAELKYYYTYPTETNSRFIVEDELSFPAITICDLRYLNAKSFLNDSKIRDAHEWWSIDTEINWSDPIYKQEGFFNNRSIEDLMKESKSLSAWYGFFNNEYLDVSGHYRYKFFDPVITDIGLCGRINGDGTLRTSQFGFHSNLRMFIELNTKDDYVFISDWYNNRPGVKVAIHDQKEEPFMEKEGIVLHTNSFSAIEIQRQEVFLPAPYKAFGNRLCNSTPGYSRNMCITDCYIREVERLCGCKPMISNYSDGPFCSKYEDLTCAKWALPPVQDYGDTCFCTHRCEFTTYSKTWYTDELPPNFRNLDDVVQVNVFYSDLTVVKNEQVPKYHDVGTLLANIGGQLGLFLGASVLTLMEVLELFLFICVRLYSKRKNGSNE